MKKLLAILVVLALMASPAFASSYDAPATVFVESDPTVDSSAKIQAIIGAGVYATSAQGGLADTAIQTEVDPTVDSSAEIQAIIGAGVYDTPVTAGDHLTRTSDDIDLDAEIYTKVASIAIADPADTMDALVQMTFPSAVTITAVACSTDTGTADIQFDERAVATPNTAGTDVLTAALQCDNNAASTTDLANASIAADVPLSMDIDAVASTPTKLRIYVKYTIDE